MAEVQYRTWALTQQSGTPTMAVTAVANAKVRYLFLDLRSLSCYTQTTNITKVTVQKEIQYNSEFRTSYIPPPSTTNLLAVAAGSADSRASKYRTSGRYRFTSVAPILYASEPPPPIAALPQPPPPTSKPNGLVQQTKNVQDSAGHRSEKSKYGRNIHH